MGSRIEVRLPRNTVDDIHPASSASPIIWNIQSFPQFGVLKVMRDLDHQQYDYGFGYDPKPD